MPSLLLMPRFLLLSLRYNEERSMPYCCRHIYATFRFAFSAAIAYMLDADISPCRLRCC